MSYGTSCQGKKTYRSKTLAKLVARRAVTAFGGSRMEAYKCPYCRSYHVGHPWKAYKLMQESEN